MKGIILAAGKGTRLFPATIPVCKPLITVYDKPLIYYPLSILIKAGISDILIITPPEDTDPFIKLFGNGKDIGINISYVEQKAQRGIADAFIIGKNFIGNDSVCLALGDNIFYSEHIDDYLLKARKNVSGATVFGYYVDDPRPFGVIEFDKSGKAISIEEKPQKPKSNYIIPGLYFYDNNAVDFAEKLSPSKRGELEITDLNLEYLKKGQLSVVPMAREVKWLDAGNCDSLLEASNCISEIQKKTGRIVGCVEEDAFVQGLITEGQVHSIGNKLKNTQYGEYLMKL